MHLWHKRVRPQLANLNRDNLNTMWNPLLKQIVATEPGLAFALDTALWDWYGQHQNQSVATLLGGIHHNPIPITEQIFIDDWEKSQQELQDILDRGTTRLKVKIGFSPAKDSQLIQQVRQFVGPNVEIRVDANRAYTLTDTIDMYKQFADLGVLAAEEPINDKDRASLQQFRQKTGLPVMLDESILTLSDLKEAIIAQAIDSLNIKLTRVGGISLARHYRQLCDEAGISISLGCNEDLGPGMAAILHMAAATANLYSTEGIGHLRLGADFITEAMPIEHGAVTLPSGLGLGVSLPANFPTHLNSRTHIFNLMQTSPLIVQGYSHFFRNRQRATTALYRLGRKLTNS